MYEHIHFVCHAVKTIKRILLPTATLVAAKAQFCICSRGFLFIQSIIVMTLDHQSPVPLRAQVEQLLRKLIQQSEYQKGALLPNETTLAAKLGVSRGTVRMGISKLVFEGLLQRKAGVGTRVATKHLESGIRAWRSFTREMAAKGIAVNNFRLDYQLMTASEDAAQALQLATGVKVWRVDRVRGWSGRPVLNSTSWFHPRLNLKGKEDSTLRSLGGGDRRQTTSRARGISGRKRRRNTINPAASRKKHSAAITSASGV